MPNLLRTGAEWLADQLQEHASVSIVYRRGQASVALDATLGSQLLRVHDGRGNSKVVRTDRDFIFRAAGLILNGGTTTPKDGDKIDLAIDSVTEKFELMPPAPNEPSWRYSDSHKTLIRAHGKFLEAV